MVIEMKEAKLSTVAQLRAFLEGTSQVQFERTGAQAQRYVFIADVLGRFRYARLGRADKGVVLRYLERVSGYSRAQVRRLVEARLGRTAVG